MAFPSQVALEGRHWGDRYREALERTGRVFSGRRLLRIIVLANMLQMFRIEDTRQRFRAAAKILIRFLVLFGLGRRFECSVTSPHFSHRIIQLSRFSSVSSCALNECPALFSSMVYASTFL